MASPSQQERACSAAQAELRIGTRLGDYDIVDVLGRGNMGFVYEAEDRPAGRRVALKVLAPIRSTSERALDRFLREAEACRRVNHPNVTAVYAAGEHDGVYFIAMELVRGPSIYDVIKAHGALEWDDATRTAVHVCRALSAAHAAGVIHRDVKPANILRAPDGVAKLTDFGLVKLTDAGAERLTREGRIVGTPQFIAPELCLNRPADARTDVYGLGGTYYMMLTGLPPYAHSHPIDLMRAHVVGPVPDPRDADSEVPEVCAAIVRKAMAKAPEDRFTGPGELEAALTAALAALPTRSSPRPRPAVAPSPSSPVITPAESGSGSESEGRFGPSDQAGKAGGRSRE